MATAYTSVTGKCGPVTSQADRLSLLVASHRPLRVPIASKTVCVMANSWPLCGYLRPWHSPLTIAARGPIRVDP